MLGLHDVDQAPAGLLGFGDQAANIGRHLGIQRRLDHRVAFVARQLGSRLVRGHRNDERDGGRRERFHCRMERLTRPGAYQDLVGGQALVGCKFGVEGGEFLIVIPIRTPDDLAPWHRPRLAAVLREIRFR